MNALPIPCVIVAGALAGATAASAATVHAVAGRPALINRESSWDRNCTPTAFPQLSLVQPPVHGSISSRPGTWTITTTKAGGAACRGRPASGEAWYYTSEPGFHGVDTIRFTTTFPNGVTLSHEATVVVR